ncbi:hypothetical protein LCGC14_0823840 [marine sediment metagenome]|uniref:Uncharacterized protein n=1 Tax=marine sediment metagenome TaxID=412755 RepID=A0A0F9Q385_9ZZZZ
MIFISPFQKFKIYNSDAAPFFFYIEVFPSDLSAFKLEHIKALLKSVEANPIFPLPTRVDRVFNGEKSLLIRPREPISFSLMDDLVASINPLPFVQSGIEKLLYFTEIRAFQKFGVSLTIDRAEKWWFATRFLYAKLLRIEEDFSGVLRAYIHTMVKAKLNDDDLINAAKKYCELVSDICNKRIKENSILIETDDNEVQVKLYKEKILKYYKKRKKVEELQYHPELVDIDVFNLSEKGFVSDFKAIFKEIKASYKKYIPLLFYDDLLECMLQNLKKLEDGEVNLLDPSYLLDKNIITINNPKDLEITTPQDLTWMNSFDGINLKPTIQLIRTILKEHFSSMKQN